MIHFRKGYKYQLSKDYVLDTINMPPESITTGYITLLTDGLMRIKKGYAFDGPSGPTIDTHTFMRGALVHDANYQLMRSGLLPQSFRKQADDLLRQHCLEDGMSRARAWWVHKGVRIGAAGAIKPQQAKQVLTAPKEKS